MNSIHSHVLIFVIDVHSHVLIFVIDVLQVSNDNYKQTRRPARYERFDCEAGFERQVFF